MITKQIINTAIKAAIDAGDEILKVYHSNDFGVEIKSDNSPVTIADKKASDLIVKALTKFNYPVLSEEEKEVPYPKRKDWSTLWVVDPLDGTKEFIKKNGEFTVNIALVQNEKPIFGIIYIPVLEEIFYGGKDIGSYKVMKADFKANTLENEMEGEKLPNAQRDDDILMLTGSRSHGSEQTQHYFDTLKKNHPKIEFIKLGSALKFCRLAEGLIDIYPRFQYCMEWDTAAGHAILQGVNKDIKKVDDNLPLVYNKENLLSPFFIAQ